MMSDDPSGAESEIEDSLIPCCSIASTSGTVRRIGSRRNMLGNRDEVKVCDEF